MPSYRGCVNSSGTTALLVLSIYSCFLFLFYETRFLSPLTKYFGSTSTSIAVMQAERERNETSLPIPEDLLSQIGVYVLTRGSTSHANMILTRWSPAPQREFTFVAKDLLAIVNAYVLDVISGETDRFAHINKTQVSVSISNLVSRREYSNAGNLDGWQIGDYMYNPRKMTRVCDDKNISCGALAPIAAQSSPIRGKPTAPKEARRAVLKAFTNKELKLVSRSKHGRNNTFPSHPFCAFDVDLLNDLHASSTRQIITANASRIVATLSHVVTSCLSCDFLRPPELHSLILWRGKRDNTKALNILNHTAALNPLVLVEILDLEPLGENNLIEWCFKMYSGQPKQPRCRMEAKGLPFPSVLLLRDTTPTYQWHKSGSPSSPPQFMNTHMRTYKSMLRKALNTRPQYIGCHSSTNVEEAALAIDYLRARLPALQSLPSTRPQVNPGFHNLSHAIWFANSFQGVGQPPTHMAFGGCSKTARTGMPLSKDVFTNNYFNFKTFTGATATKKLWMREVGRQGTTSTACRIDLVGGQTVEIDVRSLDDGYMCPIWIADSIATADRTTGMMTPLNAGFMSLYILNTYHSGIASQEQARYIIRLLDGHRFPVGDKKKNEVWVHIGFGVHEVESGHDCVKVALYHFMKFFGYSLDTQTQLIGENKTITAWWETLKDVDWEEDSLTRPTSLVHAPIEQSEA